jgi:Zn-dependent M28 family amino/carboxypeptidase
VRRSLVWLTSCSLLALACADDGPLSETDAGDDLATTDTNSNPTDSGEAETETETGDGTTDDTDEAETDETETGDEPLEPICATPLSDSITAEAIAAHLLALDAIATEHGGNRAAGTPGFEASAAYVEAQLQEAGYVTTRWPFSFDRYVQFNPASLAVVSNQPEVFTEDQDFVVPNWAPSGNVAAPIEAVDLQLGPGNLSTSGCEPEDFASFTPGNIALLQRGECTFVVKIQNAADAGAVGVLIFNQGDTEARMGLFGGSLGSQNQLEIPVLFTTYPLGVELADAAALEPVNVELSVDAGVVATETFNVLAETATGDPEHVVMLGAHLDSVPAGPGVNDNGSGTATVLEVAKQFAACSPNHKVRFAWWGAEEWGLHGSNQYVAALSDDELAQLALYLNFDMLASPNFVRFVHSGSGGPEGSTLLYDAFLEWFDAQDLSIAPAGFAGNSDYHAFVQAGVPSGGLATGAGSSKSETQARTFGGTAGEAYDACYHQACDDQLNFSMEALGQNGQATGHVLQKWATDLGALATAPDIIVEPIADVAPPIVECGHTHE